MHANNTKRILKSFTLFLCLKTTTWYTWSKYLFMCNRSKLQQSIFVCKYIFYRLTVDCRHLLFFYFLSFLKHEKCVKLCNTFSFIVHIMLLWYEKFWNKRIKVCCLILRVTKMKKEEENQRHLDDFETYMRKKKLIQRKRGCQIFRFFLYFFQT